jgi:hypothetical protein
LIVIVVVLLGGAAVFLLLDRTSQATGRYTTQPACAKLNVPPYTFTTTTPSGMADSSVRDVREECTAVLGPDPSDGSADLTLDTYLGSGGVGVARGDTAGDDQQVPGNGFENPVNVTFQSSLGIGKSCDFRYYRSNEHVDLIFISLPGVQDRDGCVNVGLPIVAKLYALTG